MTRPKIRADVAATITAAIPSRLAKKLDADPALAERWTWAGLTITTDKGEVVTLAAVEHVVTEVACSCLLSPRCLHVAAVVALLEPALVSSTHESPSVWNTHEIGKVPDASGMAVSDDRTAAAMALRTLAGVLATGAEATGAFAQAELLRAIHACRTAGLHRLAAAQTRVLRSIRELRADRPEFALAVLAADVREGLAVAHAIAVGDDSPGLRGTARREYEPIGNLALRGVFTEALVARSGYAGAITYLVDERGRFYTRADVGPGDAGRAAGAYEAGANIGDAVLPHRELGRSGLFVSGATASRDGRLGAGQQVRAVRASEPSRWEHPVIAARFAVPLAEQLAAVAAREADADDARLAGWDLVFVEGLVIGGPAGVGVLAGDVPLRFTTTLDHRALPARDNLAVLARASGLSVRAIGRVRIGAPRQLELLAIGPAPGEPRFPLPDAWYGRANLHHDRLAIVALGDAAAATALLAARPIAPAPPADDLLSPLRRRIERVVLGGIGTLPAHALAELEREATILAETALRGGADALRDLGAVAHVATRGATGVRRAIEPVAFARAWLRAALYEDAARRRLGVAAW